MAEDTFIDRIKTSVDQGLGDVQGSINNGFDRAREKLKRETSYADTFRNPFAGGTQIETFKDANTSYSGSDATVLVQINQKIIVLGSLETFSYSIFREKSPVRVLGLSHAKGYTSGGRTIAGSMVFVVFDEHPLMDVIKELAHIPKGATDRYTTPVADQMPPIDLIIWFSNEYGKKSILRLYGVEFLQEGQVHSINDIYSENTMQYVAKDIDVLVSYKDIEGFRNILFERMSSGQFVDNKSTAYLQYKKMVESKISDVDKDINTIRQEMAKRKVATLRIGFGTEDLKRQYENKLRIKAGLLKELNNINNQIIDHEKDLSGFNGQNGDGVATRSDLKHNPATPYPTTNSGI